MTRFLLLGAIRLYQLSLSPIFGPCCRFSPSCSHYGADAIGRFGALRGGWLTLSRVLRCNPWGGAGDDPVPARWTPPRWWQRLAGSRTISIERNH